MIESITTSGETKMAYRNPETGKILGTTDSSTWIVIKFQKNPLITRLECRPEGKRPEEFTVEDLKDAFGSNNIQVIE